MKQDFLSQCLEARTRLHEQLEGDSQDGMVPLQEAKAWVDLAVGEVLSIIDGGDQFTLLETEYRDDDHEEPIDTDITQGLTLAYYRKINS